MFLVSPFFCIKDEVNALEISGIGLATIRMVSTSAKLRQVLGPVDAEREVNHRRRNIKKQLRDHGDPD